MTSSKNTHASSVWTEVEYSARCTNPYISTPIYVPEETSYFICASEGSIYVSNNDGFVSRIDTTQLKVTAQMSVGPNPQHMLAVGRKVYVSISDGYNSARICYGVCRRRRKRRARVGAGGFIRCDGWPRLRRRH